MPNISQTSRSSQFAAFHSEETDGTHASSSVTRILTRKRWFSRREQR